MTRSLATLAPLSRSKALRWLRHPRLTSRLALVVAAAAILSGVATYAVMKDLLNVRSEADVLLALIYLDVVLLLLLGALVARGITRLAAARRQGSAGSRLHTRLAALLSAVAVTPAIVVAIFSVTFLHFGLEAWFNERISQALSNSLNVARSYLDEHRDLIRADAMVMASDLNREGVTLAANPALFQRVLEAQAMVRSLTEAVVFTGSGQVVARTGLSFMLEMDSLEPEVLEQAAAGDVVVVTSDDDDRVRAVVRLDNFIDAYLYVGRFVDARVLNYLDRTREVVDEYQALEVRRSDFQIRFALFFAVVTLLLLLAAVWIGLSFANGLVAPISRLVVATDRVRAGDLSARVPERREGDELDLLSRAFNRMTSQLGSQRAELIQANQQLDRRRRFTETVLAGVSAGVIGLDARGRITLPNRSAAALLASAPEDLIGKPLIAVLPEAAGLLAGVAAAPERPAETQLDHHHGGQVRALLVRAAAQLDEQGIAGFVITFDDITELLAAQRKAAWAEIARRIAHEIKNPLTPIRLSAERLKRKYLDQIVEDPDAFSASTDTIVRQVDNIGRLINEFSSFARMPAPQFTWEEAGQLIRQTVHLQQGARPEIDIETRLPEEPVKLYCDGRQVAQALINLLHNAIESILARLSDGSGERGWILVALTQSSYDIAIEVHDNGIGLPGDAVEKLTEPYVTRRRHGTGLGLAIVKKIMEEHGGSVALADRPGGGARVVLTFPAAPAATDRRPAAAAAE